MEGDGEMMGGGTALGIEAAEMKGRGDHDLFYMVSKKRGLSVLTFFFFHFEFLLFPPFFSGQSY